MSTSPWQPSLFGGLSGRHQCPPELQPRTPLVIAIHGGTYTSAYFDVPGASLLARARANRIPVLAPDRPGYGDSPMRAAGEMTIKGQARHLIGTLRDAWSRHGEGTAGIVLIGHSIGGAIAATMAAEMAGGSSDVPLLGLAVSGICMRTPPEHKEQWAQLPDTPTVEIPPPVKDFVMFGPQGSFDPKMVDASRAANTAAPKAELVDIVSTWQDQAPEVLGRIEVPVHYRQAEVDHLWIMSADEVEAFRRALKRSPRVDAAMVRGVGHCMDFHHVGRALQLQQLGFALECASAAA
ncbi:alpha/beta hydrolase [Ramlibacter sp. AW1]|uniref:Alpha/beta hydrolase n=1 Tax=Ramlibacter aurantiacus TaxID=2801330 RepID=A0A937D7E2_9BURK|nr:alpha/beta hydrolase [Ramlibacter aurantiacus]MBL0421928.1 alpha/beta hydrolase [Ramlibacter aurantiacus]